METVVMKGAVCWVRTFGEMVEVWVSSPTGDASDSHLFHIPCRSEAQAETVAEQWRTVWGLKG